MRLNAKYGQAIAMAMSVIVCLAVVSYGAITDTYIGFNSLTPAGFTLTDTWEAIGIDPDDNIYVGFVANSPSGQADNVVFKYNANTGAKKYIGTLRTAAAAANNLGPCPAWNKAEAIPKGHAHFPYMNGKMYIGSQSFHDIVDEGIDKLPNYRGAHIFTIDCATDALTDISAGQPDGVFFKNQGIVDLVALPDQNTLVGCSHSLGDILIYNVVTGAKTVIPGDPAKAGQAITRDMGVTRDGYVFMQYGFGSQAVYRYNINTPTAAAVKTTNSGCGFWNGSDYASDGRVYVSDYCNLYEINRTNNTLVKLANMNMSTIWGIVLSRDEKKVYGTPIGQKLYEYNTDTKVVSNVYTITSVNNGNYTGSGICDSKGRIYFTVHSYNGSKEGLLMIDVSERTGAAPSTAVKPTTKTPMTVPHQPQQVEIVDMRGSVVKQSVLAGGVSHLPTKSLASGVYVKRINGTKSKAIIIP